MSRKEDAVRGITEADSLTKSDNHVLKFVEESIIGTPLYGWELETRMGKKVESLYFTTKPAALSNCVNVLAMSLLDPRLIIKDENENTRGLLMSAVRARFVNVAPDHQLRGQGDLGEALR